LTDAIELYRYLVRSGPVDVDRMPGAWTAGTAGKLRELGLASTSGRLLVPVSPTTAVAHLLAARAQELAARQDALRRAYRDLIRLHDVLTDLDPGGGTAWRALSTSETAALADRLRRAARRQLLDVWTASAALTARLPDAPPVGGLSHRMILDRRTVHSPRGEQTMLALGRHATVRLATDLTACLRVVDGRHVLVWPLRCGYDAASAAVADDAAAGGIYVCSPAIARAASGLFEVLWSGAWVATPTARPAELTAAQRRTLRLMASGMSDAALARAAGSTVKTIRSDITAILLTLGVPTRFAAGVEAARRGWL
jgi:DNA-binding CsgD family transcriptional regulator